MAAQPAENNISKLGVHEGFSGAISITSSGSIGLDDDESERRSSITRRDPKIDHFRGRYPHSLVWTPITVITWFFPIFGHIGIAYTNGKVRDFADAFVVPEDRMTYGRPVKYWVMDTDLALDSDIGWDEAVEIASQEYSERDHDTLCDNSYSMIALALNLMRYKNSASWNMIWVFLYMLIYSKYVNCGGFWRTWGPFTLLVVVANIIALPFLYGNFTKNRYDIRIGNDSSLNFTSRATGRIKIELEMSGP